MGVAFVSALWFFTANRIPNNISHSPQSTYYSYQEDNWAKLGDVPKALENLDAFSVTVFCFLVILKRVAVNYV
jgi:hypothetical protein